MHLISQPPIAVAGEEISKHAMYRRGVLRPSTATATERRELRVLPLHNCASVVNAGQHHLGCCWHGCLLLVIRLFP